jgi:hypothetical protein
MIVQGGKNAPDATGDLVTYVNLSLVGIGQ